MRRTFAATTFESVKFVLRENHSDGDSLRRCSARNFCDTLSINVARNWNRTLAVRFCIKRERKMRKAIAELDAETREALLYLADLGTAVCAAGLITSLMKALVDLV
jgi:hypothetical protein